MNQLQPSFVLYLYTAHDDYRCPGCLGWIRRGFVHPWPCPLDMVIPPGRMFPAPGRIPQDAVDQTNKETAA